MDTKSVREKSVESEDEGKAEKIQRRIVWNRRMKFPVSACLVQAALIVLLYEFVDYPDEAHTEVIARCDLAKAASASSKVFRNFSNLGFTLNLTSNNNPIPECVQKQESSDVYESPYQDTQFFIMTGLSLLFMGVRRTNLVAMGFCIYIASVSLQWSLLCHGIYRLDSQLRPITPTPRIFVVTIFFTEAVFIAWGIVIGRTNPLQILIMSIIEIPLATINDYLILDILKVSDPGGVLIYNIFGTYFGLCVSKMLYRKGEGLNEDKRESTTTTESLAFLGSVILWSIWPTAMGAMYTKGQRLRCLLNTYFALVGSGVSGTAFAMLLDPEGKMTASIVQNAILAGGVAMSGAADTMMGIYFAVIVGCVAGILSVVTWIYVQPFLATKFHIVDTCGSHTLHGIPAIFGVFVSAFEAARATQSQYGESLYVTFPAMAPKANTSELHQIQSVWPAVMSGEGRTAIVQAGYQIACIASTILIASCGGIITGFLMSRKVFDPLNEDHFYDDGVIWDIPAGESTSFTQRNTNSHEDDNTITTVNPHLGKYKIHIISGETRSTKL